MWGRNIDTRLYEKHFGAAGANKNTRLVFAIKVLDDVHPLDNDFSTRGKTPILASYAYHYYH